MMNIRSNEPKEGSVRNAHYSAWGFRLPTGRTADRD